VVSNEEPAGEAVDGDADEDSAREFGAGAGRANLAKIAKVTVVEAIAETVGNIADDPFQSELTRRGGAMDGVVGTAHTAWHEMADAAHHLGGVDHEQVNAHDLHSTIHDHADGHAHLGDVPHDHVDHVDHPPDHPHHDPPH